MRATLPVSAGIVALMPAGPAATKEKTLILGGQGARSGR